MASCCERRWWNFVDFLLIFLSPWPWLFLNPSMLSFLPEWPLMSRVKTERRWRRKLLGVSVWRFSSTLPFAGECQGRTYWTRCIWRLIEHSCRSLFFFSNWSWPYGQNVFSFWASTDYPIEVCKVLVNSSLVELGFIVSVQLRRMQLRRWHAFFRSTLHC